MTEDAAYPREPWPTVVSATELSNSFLGGLLEICFVTVDHQRTMEGLVRLGIGPWRVYTFDSRTVTEQTYRGIEVDWAIKVCFADVGELALEIMQPLHGPSIFQEHLDRHGEGIHHVAFDVAQRPWDERLTAFAQRGFPVSQSGRFMDQNAFAFFDTEQAAGATFETYDIPAGFVWPQPEAWFPGPPPWAKSPQSVSSAESDETTACCQTVLEPSSRRDPDDAAEARQPAAGSFPPPRER